MLVSMGVMPVYSSRACAQLTDTEVSEEAVLASSPTCVLECSWDEVSFSGAADD